LAVSDIALKRPLPAELRDDLVAFVGCLSGAVLIDDYRRALNDAGFADVAVVDTGADLNAYALAGDQSACCPPAMSAALPLVEACCPSSGDAGGRLHERLARLLQRFNVNDYAASVRVFAVRP
jgi:hypothetical protein